MEITIPGTFTTLNEYIAANNINRYESAKIKREETERVVLECYNLRGVKPSKYPLKVTFHWYCPNRKSDPDNIAFAKKFILDGLVEAGMLQNDGWKQIASLSDFFHIDKANPRVSVSLVC